MLENVIARVLNRVYKKNPRSMRLYSLKKNGKFHGILQNTWHGRNYITISLLSSCLYPSSLSRFSPESTSRAPDSALKTFMATTVCWWRIERATATRTLQALYMRMAILIKSSYLVKQWMDESETKRNWGGRWISKRKMVECKRGCHIIRRISVASLTFYCNLWHVSFVYMCKSK